ncbi:MAG: Gamma-glutamyltranspeptidase [Chloroflexi bacterium AL-W]|nr:Gamma-glutamyltranspeptidase [Chloroflexi bacterium AL-N1]NOK67979.1 Gamma-glutamyltranspeptidase [Chloroflexi bacterium AL-N10]NOK73319.1 Gamma-glutamyltranspeptidase [Chloroflexi bacterium AL-N5]NOK83233.1 Gamma-glutamyltranspeptidase [Chloroflexi bacterium AL-W]NOK87650.1 Gamma-glutamyltranspeptidase [Chloroflexi bacterium AL-N15]
MANLHTTIYPARRTPLVAANGVVATSHPLAAQAGLTMLQAGGTAVDAAVATAIALTVLEPTSNGIGGDTFAMVWDGTQLHGLNGSGRAPAGLTVDAVQQAGYTAVPSSGWLSVTVPGAPAAWQDLHQRFGKLPFARLFEPAIAYAENGHPVAPIVSRGWSQAVAAAQQRNEPEFAGFLSTFVPSGAAPSAGDLFVSPGHARTLRHIAEQGADAFYKGAVAEAIVHFAQRTGGLLTADDLAAHTSTWVDPISIEYRGHTIWELPPNGQGLAALLTLGMLEGLDIAQYPRDSAAAYHLQIEAMKLAFADAYRYIADPAHAEVPLHSLLDPVYLAARRALIGPQACFPEPGQPPRGGTVYLCAADSEGRMVSLIQSNFWGFGSGVVVPDWGIALQNRGHGFTLEAGHPNQLAPYKRPFHTIIPAFMTRNGQPMGPFGVMGGEMQPQGHTQVAINTLDYGMHPQAALDAPRWRVAGETVFVELDTPRHVIEGLAERGHVVQVAAASGGFGRGQAIWRLPSGAYVAGSETRCDGCAVGW